MSIRVERSEVYPSGRPGGGPGAGVTRLAGAVLATGPLIWAIGLISVGEIPEETIDPTDMITGVFFLAGLIALAWVTLASRATGDRKGRAFPIIPILMAPFGMIVNLASLPHETFDDLPLWVNILDPFWPLTQIAMLASAIAIARMGRWRGALRWLPLAGALWLPVALIGEAALGDPGSVWVFGGWMAITYGALGALLVARPDAVRP